MRRDGDLYVRGGRRGLTRERRAEKGAFMIYSEELLNRLHRLSYANRPLVERSTVCGCFHCGAIYSPNIIDPESDYCIDFPADTAICHFCWIDSVICDSMGVEITSALLDDMREMFFEESENEITQGIDQDSHKGKGNNMCNLKTVRMLENSTYLCEAVLADGRIEKLDKKVIDDVWGNDYVQEIEGYSVFPSGDLLVLILSVASGQGGVIVLWDYEHNKVIHISEGAYVCSVAVIEDKVVSLRLVTNFTSPAHFGYTVCPVETMDAWKESEFVPLSLDASDIKDPFRECGIDYKDGRVVFFAGNATQTVTV